MATSELSQFQVRTRFSGRPSPRQSTVGCSDSSACRRLKIDPQLTGINAVPQARLTVEQQVSRDVTLTYITNLAQANQQIVRLEWDIDRTWSVVALREENGAFGIDFFFKKRIQVKLRTAQGKLKIEHSIIDGVRDLLKRCWQRILKRFAP